MWEAAAQFGNAALHEKYLDICRWLVKKKAAQVGYSLRRWTGYYCGFQSTMTHFAAVLVKAGMDSTAP